VSYTVAALQTPLIASEDVRRGFLRRAGIVFGVIVALGFAASFWLPDALILRQASAEGWWIKLALGTAICLPVCALIGWLAAGARWSAVAIGGWLLGGVGLAWLGGRVAFDGLSLAARLVDPYPSAQVMYPFTPAAQAYTGISMVIGAGAGLLTGLLSLLLTERAWEHSTRANRLGVRSIAVLLLGVPPVVLLGFMADFQIQSSSRTAIEATAQVITQGVDRTVDLGQARLPYLQPYRDQLSAGYVTHLVGLSADLTTATVDVTFESGLLLRCAFGFGSVFFCGDTGRELNQAMTDLLTVGHPTCNDCGIQVDRDVRAWLVGERSALGTLRDVRLWRHLGGWLYLRGTFDSGRAVDCRFAGSRPIVVNLCIEATD
jgi:hypothetical protein